MAGQTIINLGTGGSVLNGQSGSTTGADSNDPKFLDWPGDNGGNYIYMNIGTAGTRGLQVPDAVDLRITGDIDLRAWIALDDWTPAANHTVISKYWESDPNRGYLFEYRTTGAIRLVWSTNGLAAGVITATSTATVTATDGAPLWIRATLDVDNGAGGYDAKFYTSTDGVTWTQLGATVTGASTTSIYASDRTVEVGTYSNGFGTFYGNIYRAQIYSGIAGTKVLDVDTSVITSGSATSFTAITGQTVTILRPTAGRKPVAVVAPVWLFGTDDYIEVADHALLDFGASDSFSVLAVIRQWNTAVSFGRYVDKREATGTNIGWNLTPNNTAASVNTSIDDGPDVANRAGLSNYTIGATSCIGVVVDRAAQTIASFSGGTLSASTSTSAVGSISNAEALRIGAGAGVSNYQDFELLAVAVFRRALSAAELTQLSTYYASRWP